MKMKSVKAVLILLLLIAGMVTGYLLWKMKEPEYEKEGLFVDNGVVAYYNYDRNRSCSLCVSTGQCTDRRGRRAE